MFDDFEKGKLITEDDINKEDIQIDEESISKEVKRLAQSRYEKMRRRASKKAIKDHNNNAKKYISEEKIRRQREMMLTKIPKRYRDLYPLAREIKRHFILHVGPTNSGKTYEAIKELAKADSGVYLAPLRLLAYENYEKLTEENVKVSMITGEEEIITPGAVVTCSTVEMLNLNERYEVAVIDEAQMITDRDRGGAWTQAILGVCADKVHICLAEQALSIILKLIEECEDSYEIVRHERKTDLRIEKRLFHFLKMLKMVMRL